MEHEEYTAENYPSFGKKYNGEKAIISLTSWKARINTVSKTLFSLLKQCPGFHIVLVLSEEEFPKMMDELPETLKLFAENELIEILWVYKNYKSFKKVLFTMDKYRTVPVISADDDCIYIKNYAEELYNVWEKNPEKFVRYCLCNLPLSHFSTQGPCTLYPPNVSRFFILTPKNLFSRDINDDDGYLTYTFRKYKIKMAVVHRGIIFPFIFHDEIKPLSRGRNRFNPHLRSCYK